MPLPSPIPFPEHLRQELLDGSGALHKVRESIPPEPHVMLYLTPLSELSEDDIDSSSSQSECSSTGIFTNSFSSASSSPPNHAFDEWPDTSSPTFSANKLPDEQTYSASADGQIQHFQLDDTHPAKNLTTSTPWTVDEVAERLKMGSSVKDIPDPSTYSRTLEIETKCVEILAQLFNAPQLPKLSRNPSNDAHGPENRARIVESTETDVFGASTVSNSEAIMLCTLAMKEKWKSSHETRSILQKPKKRNFQRPNIILSSMAPASWRKAAQRFDLERRIIPVSEERFVMDPEEALSNVDDHTIGICCTLGNSYTGHFDDIKKIDELLTTKHLEIPIHVDARSGGFVAPFMRPGLAWDFRLPHVTSINVSGDKYGLVSSGISWALWRSQNQPPAELNSLLSLGAETHKDFTMNFNKSSSHILSQYYQLIQNRRSGYRKTILGMTQMADYLACTLQSLGFVIISPSAGAGVPIVAFRLPYSENLICDEYALSSALRDCGWVVPACSMTLGSRNITIMRIVCRADFTAERVEEFLQCLKQAISGLEERWWKRAEGKLVVESRS